MLLIIAFIEAPASPFGILNEHITMGSDGRLWIARIAGNAILALTLDGVFTSYPTAGSPFNVATGKDGNIWFTDFSSSKIDKLIY